MSDLIENGFKLMKQGAEAKLYSGAYLGKPTIVKERFSKAYRHPILDSCLVKERTKSEAKTILKALMSDIRTPALYFVDYPSGRIYMEYIQNSVTIRDYINGIIDDSNETLEASNKKTLNDLMGKIGEVIGRLHQNHIIHGDLTTSNMLYLYPNETNTELEHETRKIMMIDFGLSYIDISAEDKGVDLYVLERALTSTHSTVPYLFNTILDSYKKVNKNQAKEVLAKLDEVRTRGRKRTMVG